MKCLLAISLQKHALPSREREYHISDADDRYSQAGQWGQNIRYLKEKYICQIKWRIEQNLHDLCTWTLKKVSYVYNWNSDFYIRWI